MKSDTLSLKAIINELDFLKKAGIIQWNTCKQITKKMLDHRNVKEHYQSFIRKKNKKSVKKTEIITYRPKTFEKLNIVYIKSVITEHAKTS